MNLCGGKNLTSSPIGLRKEWHSSRTQARAGVMFGTKGPPGKSRGVLRGSEFEEKISEPSEQKESGDQLKKKRIKGSAQSTRKNFP